MHMNVKIVAVGKIKNKFLKSISEDYQKRLSPFVKLKIDEIEAESFHDNGDKIRVKVVEADKLLGRIKKVENKIMILDERGVEFTSDDFAKELMGADKGLTFIIGGTLGLAESILSLPYKKVALSKMTFTHEMARVFLLEQIYRGITIIQGKNYHY